ncbi:MAG: serine hydrolase [Patescibacteria group bacterium]|nr:serine hydrolase [Patescibacteria group bacterium]
MRAKKILLISFLISLPFWFGVNVFAKNLDNFLFLQQIAKNPEILSANIGQQVLNEKVNLLKINRLQNELRDLEISASAGISVFVNPAKEFNQKNIIFAKNINEELPIASITKLMTALVVLENYDLSKEIKVSQQAVNQPEGFGKLQITQSFTVKQMLYPLLIESSNDAAFSLANDYKGMTEKEFVHLMNFKAQEIGLKNTHFINPTGLDVIDKFNYSSAKDLVTLTAYLLREYPIVWEILGLKEFELRSLDNTYVCQLSNTNKLLGKIPGMIGGKTGKTRLAGECLVLVLKTSEYNYLINVILGSTDRFEEMTRLIKNSI